MSMGERSCIHCYKDTCPRPAEPNYLDMMKCDVDCEWYVSNGKPPDSSPQKFDALHKAVARAAPAMTGQAVCAERLTSKQWRKKLTRVNRKRKG